MSTTVHADRLTILIPVYNERDCIAEVFQRLRDCRPSEPWDVQWVVVDDGSSDGTGEILAENLPDGAELIRREINGGKTAAIRDGLRIARGTWVIIQDADLEYDPTEIPKLLAEIGPDTVAVYGRRPSHWKNPQRWVLAAGVLAVDVGIWVLHRKFVRDHATCYKLIRRDVLEQMQLTSVGFEGCVEITCRLIQLGHEIKEVPIRYTPRSYAEGKKLTAWHGLRAFWQAWRCRGWKPHAKASAHNPVGDTHTPAGVEPRSQLPPRDPKASC